MSPVWIILGIAAAVGNFVGGGGAIVSQSSTLSCSEALTLYKTEMKDNLQGLECHYAGGSVFLSICSNIEALHQSRI